MNFLVFPISIFLAFVFSTQIGPLYYVTFLPFFFISIMLFWLINSTSADEKVKSMLFFFPTVFLLVALVLPLLIN